MQQYDKIETLKNNGDKDQETFTLKLVLAGSGQNNFRKVNLNEKGEQSIDQYNYFKDDDDKDGNNNKYDLINFKSTDLKISEIIKGVVTSSKIKEGDFFYRYSETKNQLSLYRPGPGANLKDKNKIDYRFDSGRYSIDNSITLLSKQSNSNIRCN